MPGRVSRGGEAAPDVTGPESGASAGGQTAQVTPQLNDMAVMSAAITSPRNPFFRSLLPDHASRGHEATALSPGPADEPSRGVRGESAGAEAG